MCRSHNGILTSISELLTPKQHPLLDQVLGAQRLHLAVGDSYHSFKFLPVFRNIVVAYLQGIRSGVSKRWGWNRTEEKVSVYSEILTYYDFHFLDQHILPSFPTIEVQVLDSAYLGSPNSFFFSSFELVDTIIILLLTLY